MRKVYLLVAFSIMIILSSFTYSVLQKTNDKPIKIVVPKGWPKSVYDFKKNPITENGFQLGKKLFFDPILSRDSSTSCASCHLQNTNYTHVDHALSHGIDGLQGNRNTLSIMNTAWTKNFMWDGGINHIEVQPLAPIENKVEMDNKLDVIISKLKKSNTYKSLFKDAFGDSTKITGQYFLKALAQYMTSFVSYNSKYDKVMRKEKGFAFTESESKGLLLFRKHCESCHREPLFTNNSFENNGLPVDTELNDGGRIKITHLKSDSLKFKVPSLRNIEVSYPYMHDGRFKSLQMVLFHYSAGIQQTINISGKLKNSININEDDKRNIIAFLKTLTDKTFLTDPRFKAPNY